MHYCLSFAFLELSSAILYEFLLNFTDCQNHLEGPQKFFFLIYPLQQSVNPFWNSRLKNLSTTKIQNLIQTNLGQDENTHKEQYCKKCQNSQPLNSVPIFPTKKPKALSSSHCNI